MCWRLWAEQRATWTELNTSMSLDDVMDANEILDAWHSASKAASK